MWAERIHKERRRLGLEEPGGPTTADLMSSNKRARRPEVVDDLPVKDVRPAYDHELFRTAQSDLEKRRSLEVERPCIMEWRSKRRSATKQLQSASMSVLERFEMEPRLARLERSFPKRPEKR
eukprot:symbB.v1.2.018184.t1/scaffold1436.1/size118852/7